MFEAPVGGARGEEEAFGVRRLVGRRCVIACAADIVGFGGFVVVIGVEEGFAFGLGGEGRRGVAAGRLHCWLLVWGRRVWRCKGGERLRCLVC